jgi:transcriptional regulator GlxA family with amidase domain
MSARNFARRFKAATGDTPLEYMHRLRINAAKHLLESDSTSIQEVSNAVGYDDMIFFRRLFRRYAGVAPSEYRIRFGVGGKTSAQTRSQR